MKTWTAFFAAVVLSAGISSACPLCKDGTPAGDDTVTETAAVNFNPSIYGLLGGVVTVAGFAGFAMVRSVGDGK
jgi:hypothetical protein